jgi:hypothetical protein
MKGILTLLKRFLASGVPDQLLANKRKGRSTYMKSSLLS